MSGRALGLVALAAVGLGCGGGGAFGLTSEDNNPEALAQAFALRGPERAGEPINATGKPLVFLSERGNKKQNKSPALIAFDLAAKKQMWRVETGVKSKVVVGARFIAHVDDDGALIGRALETGAQMWKVSLGAFLGAAADADRVYYVTEDKSGSRPVWYLVAVDGMTGTELWRADSPGQLGTPVAHRGLVYSPFLRQWLAILDAKTGAQVARIRGLDEEISFVKKTSNHVYFGSKAGVFLMDERAASGQRSQSTYGSANLPEESVRGHYYWDAFDSIQTGYSAYDRNRILWRGAVQGDNLGFADDLIVVHTYRFFFAFDAKSGEMRWAYNHPRVDIVASAHVGGVIGIVSRYGEIGALDARTGAPRYEAQVEGQFLGATFDADGWAPTGEGEPPSTVATLSEIARDRDARFNEVKRFAVLALAKQPGGEVTRDLIELIQAERTPPKLRETAIEVLVARKDVSGLPHLVRALSVRHDFIADTRPRAVGVLARAIRALADQQLDPGQRGAAVDALLFHLQAPQTPVAELVHVIGALGAIGAGAEIQPLRSFVLAYRVDPAFSAQTEAIAAAIDVLIGAGGAAERELVGFVADDARTQPSIAEYANRALQQTAPTGAEGGTTGGEGGTGASGGTTGGVGGAGARGQAAAR